MQLCPLHTLPAGTVFLFGSPLCAYRRVRTDETGDRTIHVAGVAALYTPDKWLPRDIEVLTIEPFSDES